MLVDGLENALAVRVSGGFSDTPGPLALGSFLRMALQGSDGAILSTHPAANQRVMHVKNLGETTAPHQPLRAGPRDSAYRFCSLAKAAIVLNRSCLPYPNG
jgi:hypothetical protein